MTKQDIENNLGRIHEWIKSIDQKVSVFLAFQGIVLTLLFSDVFSWSKRHSHSFSCIDIVILVTGIVLLGFSIYKSITAIIPRLKNHKGHKSITYFKDIAEFELKDYKKKVRETNEKEYEEELINQVHISAVIAKRKHQEFRDSIIFFLVGMGLLVAIFFIQKFFYGY
jgi:hypothetical protein